MPPDAIESFITRWENSGAAERANYQMFLSELCVILETKQGVSAPELNVAAVYDRRANEEAPCILLTALRQEKHRPTLRAIWTDPYSNLSTQQPFEVKRAFIKLTYTGQEKFKAADLSK